MPTTINFDIIDSTMDREVSGTSEEGDVSNQLEQIKQAPSFNRHDRLFEGYGQPVNRANVLTNKTDNSEKFRDFHIFNLAGLPATANIRRVTMSVVHGEVTLGSTATGQHFAIVKPLANPATSVYPAYGTGAGEMSGFQGFWNITGGYNEHAHKMIQAIAEVRDSGGVIGTPSTTGPSQTAGGGQPTTLVDTDGMRAWGVSLVAPSTFTLAEVRWRASRTVLGGGLSSWSKTLVTEIWSVVSAANPRTDTLLATSDDFAFDSLKSGTIPSPTPTSGWAQFVFSGGDAIEITAGTRYAIKLVEKGNTTLPIPDGGGGGGLGTGPYVTVGWDSGIAGGGLGTPTDSANNTATGLLWGGGGLSRAAYPYSRLLPQPYENFQVLPTDLDDANTGILFNGATEPFAPNIGNGPNNDGVTALFSVNLAVTNVFGEVLPGFGVDQTGITTEVEDLVQLLQDWVDATDVGDGTPYDESGQQTLIVGEPVSVTGGSVVPGWATHDGQPTGGMVLGITWVEDAPGKATNPDPANLAVGVSLTKILSWTTGTGIVNDHEVFFGTDPDPSGNSQGLQDVSVTTFDPGPLSEGVTYFWRVDEINADNTREGDIWQFTAEVLVFEIAFLDADIEVVPAIGRTKVGLLSALSAEPRSIPAMSGKSRLAAVLSAAVRLAAVFTGKSSLKPAVDGEATLDPVTDGEAKLQPAIDADVCAGPAIDGEAPLEPALDGEARIEPALDGEASLRGGTTPKGRLPR